MEFILARHAGFCPGVKRALSMVLEASTAAEGSITTLGPLVHNPQVIDLMKIRDVDFAESPDEILGGLVVIRSHGVSPEIREKILAKGLKLLDATCPKVARVQKLAEQYALEGRTVLIFGEPDHPEIQGICGYARGRAVVISGLEEYRVKPHYEKVALISQTTQDEELFTRLAEVVQHDYPDAAITNTICSSTHLRQEEIRQMAKEVDAMIVVGGKNSGNTRRLVRISQSLGLPTFAIETDQELRGVDFRQYKKIGVTAGASTPAWIIERLMLYLKDLEEQHKNPVRFKLKKILEALVLSHIYTSLAAGMLCYLSTRLQGVPFSLSLFSVVFGYVLSMHVLNRLSERGADRFKDDPKRQMLYKEHPVLMILLGFGSAIGAISWSVSMGILPFLVILFASILGVLYSVKVVPKKWIKKLGFRRLKDIAASKNFFVASAWAVVSVFPLFFFYKTASTSRTLATFVFLFLVTGIRSILIDLSGIAGDRLIGRETVPLVIGEKNTKVFAKAVMAVVVLYLFLMAAVGVFPALAYLVAGGIAIEFLLYRYILPERLKKKMLSDIILDGHFIIAGILIWIIKTAFGF